MIYHQKNRKRRKISSKIVFSVFIFLFLIFSQYLFSESLKNSLFFIYKPLWVVSESIKKPFSIVGDFFRSKNSILLENKSLQDGLAKFELKNAEYELVLKENEDLKAQLGRKNSEKRILANILARPPQSPYDTYIIDIGLDQGVLQGSRAYLSNQIIVGEVTEVRKNSSVVQLYSTSGKSTNTVLDRTGTSYEVKGMGGQNYILYIPKDADLVWGDILLVPGAEKAILGSVYYIDSNLQSSFKIAYIRASVNTFSTNTVYIEQKDSI